MPGATGKALVRETRHGQNELGLALGRKNYLFVGHPRAGRNIAGLYSLVGSCIANKVEPTEYLTDVLPRIASASTDTELDLLLPDRWVPNRSPPQPRPDS
jgi:transposase